MSKFTGQLLVAIAAAMTVFVANAPERLEFLATYLSPLSTFLGVLGGRAGFTAPVDKPPALNRMD